MTENSLLVKLLRPTAKYPTRGTVHSSGLDLYAVADLTLEPREVTVIPFGIAVQLPGNCEAQIRGRSSMTKRGLLVQLGTIDNDYRGEVGAAVYNANETMQFIKAGDRIAQLVVAPVNMCEAFAVPELTDTMRGDGGWGSTGP